MTTTLINTGGYGPEYLSQEVYNVCMQSPDERLWDVYASVMAIAFRKMEDEAREAANAEHKRQWQETRKAQLEKYSDSLYRKEIANCKNFTELVYLSRARSEEREHFERVLQLTMDDMPRPERADQRQAFEDHFKKDPEFTVSLITGYCNDNTSPEQAVLDSPIVRPKGPY